MLREQKSLRNQEMPMHKIKLLDEDTINKIAAGEVIERPSSAVKEMVENSIDAGATKILIEVAEGGKSLIKVTDDGCGMEPEDLTMAFQKHATSKITGAKDLDKIKTMGFRGEALASIASVTRSLEVYTKTRTAPTGTYLRMEGGRVVEKKEIGCPIGTSIAVRDLFYNVPARRKHLKGAEAELVHIVDAVTEMAIINYGISFELFSGKRTLFRSSKSNSWDEVLLKIFDLKTLKGMMPFCAKGPNCRQTGAAGDPTSTRSSPDRIFVYVNGRPVSSKALTAALREAYRSVIPSGRSPIAVLSLEIIPDLVDVNVHPTKREIRLLQEEEISAALTLAVSEVLRANAEAKLLRETPRTELPSTQASVVDQKSEQKTLPLDVTGEEVEVSVASEITIPQVKVLGQVLKLYILAESDQGLLIIDQHAAAERIRFERLKALYGQKKISQELAEPVTIDLAPNEQVLIESWKDVLQEIGFEISPFGGKTYHVRAVPALGRKVESPEAVYDVLRALFTLGKVGPEATSKEDILKLLACKGSIKSGRELSMQEMASLLKDLYACNSPLTCPHGRPVIVAITQAELERLFLRR
jgi:DNA mismatch repair protein MutL